MAIRAKGPSVSQRPMKTGNTRWLNNAMKSIGMAASNELKEIAPNLHETFETGIGVSKSISKSIRGNKQGAANIQNALNTNKYVKYMQTAVKNSITDIKRGTFYNTTRFMEDASEEDEFSGGFSFGDDEADTNIINVGDGAATVKAVSEVSKQLTVNASANIKMQKASMDAYIATSAAGMQQVGELGAEIVNQLQNVNSNLAAIVQYNNENMTKFIEATTTYYEKVGGRAANETKDDEKLSGADVLKGSKGGLNISNYKKYVKQQVKDMADSSTAGMILNLLEDDDMMKMLVSNPLGLMSQGVVKYAMPKIFTTSIQAMEMSFSSLVPKLLSDIGKWADEEGVGFAGRIKKTIGKAFGVKEENITSLAKNAKIDYGPMPFDGETKHAITHLITKELGLQTGYLQIIASHYKEDAKESVEQSRQFWDKNNNKYVSKIDLEKNIANTVVDAIKEGFDNTAFGKQLSNFVQESGKDDETKKNMENLVREFYSTLSQSNGNVDINSILDIVKSLNGTQDEKGALARYIAKISKQDKKAFNTLSLGKVLSRSNANKAKKEITKNASDYHLFDTSFADKDINVNDQIDKILDFNRYYKELGKEDETGSIKKTKSEILAERAEANKRYGAKSKSNKESVKKDVELDETLDSYKLSNFDYGNLDPEKVKQHLTDIVGSVSGTVKKLFTGATATDILGDVYQGAKKAGKAFLDSNSELFNEVKQNFVEIGNTLKDGLKTKFFGDPDKPDEKGIFGIIGDTITGGAKGWADALFGPEVEREKDNQTLFKEFMTKAKENLPKDITAGLIGGGVGIATSGSLLGAMIGGPIGGAVLGVATSILSRNERFQNFLFGEKDEDGNRLGGFISKETQDWAKEHKKDLIGGATFGAITGTITGGGVLGMLVGGPVAGALMGMASTTLLKSQTFHDFVFGNEETGQKGFAQGIKDAFNRHFRPKNDDETDMTKAVGMSILGAGAGGILGAVFGGPVLGAVAGLGLAIKAQSSTFKEWLFGKEVTDENGKTRKHQGVVGQISNILNANLLQPLKTNLAFMAKDALLTIEADILTPIKFGAEIAAGKVGDIVSDIRDKANDLLTNTVEGAKSFLSTTFAPVVDAVTTAVDGVTTFAYNTTKAIITAPFKLVAKGIDFAVSKVGKVVNTVLDGVTTAIGIVKDAFVSVAKTTGKLIAKGLGILFKPLTWAAKTVLGGAGRAFKSVGQGIGDWVNDRLVTYSGGGSFADRWNAAKGVNRDKRKAFQAERQAARQHNENAKYIAKYTKGQYSVDSDEAREYLKTVNYRAWQRKFGGDKNKDNISLTEEGKRKEAAKNGMSIAGMSDSDISKISPNKLDFQGRVIQLLGQIKESTFGIKKTVAEDSEEGTFLKGAREREKAEKEEAEKQEQPEELSPFEMDRIQLRDFKKKNMEACNNFLNLATNGDIPKYSRYAISRLRKEYPDIYAVYVKCTRSNKWPKTLKEIDDAIKEEFKESNKQKALNSENATHTFLKDRLQEASDFLFGNKNENEDDDTKDKNKTTFIDKVKKRVGDAKQREYDRFQGFFAEGGTPEGKGVAVVGEKGAEAVLVDKDTHIASSDDTRKAITDIAKNRDKLKQAQEDAKTAKEQREEREKAEEKKSDKEYKTTMMTRMKDVVKNQKQSMFDFLKSFGKKSLFAIGTGLVANFLIKHPGVISGAINVIGTIANTVKNLFDKLEPVIEFIKKVFNLTDEEEEWTKEHNALTDGQDSEQALQDNINQIKNGHLLTDKKGNLNHQSGARAKLLAKGGVHLAKKGITKVRNVAKGIAKKVGLKYNTKFDDIVDGTKFIKDKVTNRFAKKTAKKEVLTDSAQGWLQLAESTGDDAIEAVASKGEKKLGKKVSQEAAEKTIKKSTSKAAKKATNFVDDVGKNVTKTAGKVAAEGVDDVAKAGAELAEKGSKGLLKKTLSLFDDAIKFITKSAKSLAERFGKSKAGDIASKIFGKFKPESISTLIEKHFPKISAKIEAIAGGKGAAVAATAGLADAAFVVVGALNGLTGAKRLFHVDDVDAKMIAIAGIWGGLAGTMIGSIIDVINELIFDIKGKDFIGSIAVNIYNFLSSDEDTAKLEKAQQDFKSKYDEYQEKSLKEQWKTQIEAGIIDSSVTFEDFKASIENNDGVYKASYKSFADYNDEEHASFLGKVGKKIGKGAKAIGKAVVGTEKYTDSNGNTYTKNAEGDFDVKNKNGKRIGTIAKDAIPEDAKKGEQGGIVGTVKTAIRGNIAMGLGKKTYKDPNGIVYTQKADGSYDVKDASGKSLGNISSAELPEEAKKVGRTGGILGGIKSAVNSLKDGAGNLANKVVETGKSVFGISDAQLANTDPSKLDPSSRSAYYLHAIFEKLTGDTDTRSSRMTSVQNAISLLSPTTMAISTSSRLKQLIQNRKSSTSSTTRTTGGSGEGSYFSQNDSRWANKAYGNDGATMKDSGCGPAAVAMAVNDAKKKKSVDPMSMANLAKATGDRDETGTNWNFINKASSAMGLRSSQNINPSASDIYSQVNSGNPVILSGSSDNSGPYTKAGHYIVADGTDSKGNIKVKDPRGKGYSKTYDPSTLAKHTGSSWTIGGHGKKSSGVAITEKAKGLANLARKAVNTLTGGSASETDYQRWLSIVKEAKRQIGEQKLGYYTHNGHKSVTVTIDGKSATARTDCSGFVDICLQLYGVLKSGTGLTTYSMTRDSATMKGTGFTCLTWPGWESLIPGDIIVNTNSHTEIFSRNDGGTHYVYNCGSNDSCNNTGETRSGKSSYELVWRPGAAGEGAVDGSGSTTAVVSSGETSLFSKIGSALAGATSEVFNRILKGDTKNTDYSTIINNAFAGTSTSSSSNTDGATSADNLQGGTTAQKVWNYFTGNGYSKEATAGILGNLEQESGVNPSSIQGNGKGPAAGIAQWENYNTKSSRWKELENYANSKGKEWTDLGSQLEFIDKELKGLGSFWNYQSNMSKAGTTGTSYDKWKVSTDVETATRQFEGAFERAGTPMMDKRVSAAKGYYNKFSGGGSGLGHNGGYGIYDTTLSAGTVPIGTSVITTKDKETAAKNKANDAKRAVEYANKEKAKSKAASQEMYNTYIDKQKRAYNKKNDPSYGGRYTAIAEKEKGLAAISTASNDGSIKGSASQAAYNYATSASTSNVDISEAVKYFKQMVKILSKIEGHTNKSSGYLKNMKNNTSNNIILADGSKATTNKSNGSDMLEPFTNSRTESSGFATADMIARGSF